MKTCSRCKVEKEESQFGPSSYVRKDGTRNLSAWCKQCAVIVSTEYQKKNPEMARIWNRRKHYRRKYNITQAEYDQLAAAQNGVCAICKEPERHITRGGHLSLLAVDHCHKTGKIRGLLCFACNTALGKFRDNPDRLLEAHRYLSF